MKSTACRLTSSHGVMNYPRAVPPNTRIGSQQFSRRASAVDQSQQQLWPAQHQENKAHRPEFIRDQRPSLKSIEPKGSVVAVILGGAESDSKRMYPLTERRTLPAIPVGGMYRLIDIPMSNLINSGVNKIYILAQYQSTSLNHYLNATYNFQASGIPLGGDGYMEVVSATQGPDSKRWAEGSADSVRQFMKSNFSGTSRNRYCQDIIVLPSDQIYHMDFCRLVEAHRANDADMTIVCRTASASAADHLGIVKIGGGTCQIDKFREKPKGVELTGMSMSWDEIDAYLHSGFTSEEDEPEEHEDGERTYVGSCGIYVFKREALEKLLEDKDIKDIGRDLIPAAVAGCYNVVAANMDGYWADIGGSIKDYYDFSMSLVLPDPPFSFIHKHGRQIFAHPENLPPVLIDSCKLHSTIIGPGCTISQNSEFSNSIIGSRAVIGTGCSIMDSVIMGSDYFESEKKFPRPISADYPPIGVGPGCTIHKAIIDNNSRIGAGCLLLNREGIRESGDRFGRDLVIRDGIIVVQKAGVVPDGTIV